MRNRLLLWIISPLVLVYTLMIGIELKTGRDEAIQTTTLLLTESTSKHAGECDRLMVGAAQIAKNLAFHLDNTPDIAFNEIERLARRCLEEHPRLLGVCVTFEPGEYPQITRALSPFWYRMDKGDAILYMDTAANYNYSNRDWYLVPKLTGKETWADPYKSRARKKDVYSFAVPILRDGRYIAQVRVDIGLNEIRELIAHVTSDGAVYRLINSTGRFISAPEPEVEMHHTIYSLTEWNLAEGVWKDPAKSEAILKRITTRKTGSDIYRDMDTGERTHLFYAPLKEIDGTLLASIPESRIFRPLYRRLAINLGISCLGFLLILGIIAIVSFRMTRPLRSLAALAREIAAGNLDTPFPPIHIRDEIGQLAETLRRMVIDLKEHIAYRITEEASRKILEGELSVARRVQESLLPRVFPPFPEHTEFTLHAVNVPAKFVAGDFFDFFFIDEHTLVFLIADVSGKGIPAALLMAVSRTALRNFAGSGISPSEVVHRLNKQMLQDNHDSMFLTLFYAHYDIRSGRLDYVNAGHNPPYLIRGGGTLETLEPTSMLVGAFETEFKEATAFLQPDDTLFAFTDGATEAHRKTDIELFGEKRLESLLRAIADYPIKEMCDTILMEVEAFAEGERFDDVTMIVLRNGMPGGR